MPNAVSAGIFKWHSSQVQMPYNLSAFIINSFCSLYYSHITIINYESSIANKFGASLTDDATVFIYDFHMFIV